MNTGLPEDKTGRPTHGHVLKTKEELEFVGGVNWHRAIVCQAQGSQTQILDNEREIGAVGSIVRRVASHSHWEPTKRCRLARIGRLRQSGC